MSGTNTLMAELDQIKCLFQIDFSQECYINETYIAKFPRDIKMVKSLRSPLYTILSHVVCHVEPMFDGYL